MATTATEKREYSIQIAWGDYREDHDYGRSDVYPWTGTVRGEKVTTLDEAVAAAQKMYGEGSGNSAVAFWVHEAVTTTTVEDAGDGRTVTTTVQVEQKDAYTHYRSFDNWMEEVVEPAARREVERVASGEAALSDAYQDELMANSERRQNGEPLVHTAEKAWLEFKGYPVPSYITEEEKAVIKRKSRLRMLNRGGFFG